MNIKMKVKTLVAILLVALVMLVGATLTFNALQSAQSEPNRLIKRIENTYPTEDAFIYFNGFTGYTGSSATRETVAAEKQAIELIYRMMNEYAEHEWTVMNAEWSLAQLYRKHGKWNEALHYFRKVADSDVVSEDLRMHAKQWIQLLDPAPIRPDAVPVLSGRVWMGDAPTNEAYVYLIPADTTYWRTPNPPLYNHYPITVTNEQGEFRFYENVTPGEYYVGIGIHPMKIGGFVLSQQHGQTVSVESSDHPTQYDVRFVPKVELIQPVDGVVISEDTIIFEWQPYPDAVSYRIGIGEILLNDQGEFERAGTMIYFNEIWEGTTAVYEIEELRKKFPGFSSHSQNGVDPFSFLGLVYPGGHFTWGIYAYDEHGNRISDSTGFYLNHKEGFPIFSLDDEGQLEGDRYVIARKFDQAIAAYEKDIDHPHALRALAKIYYIGTDFEGEEHQDLDKAIEYFKRVPDLTADEKEFIKMLERKRQFP